MRLHLTAACAALVLMLCGCVNAPDARRSVRLYALDCGRMVTNGIHATNPCFLIRHPKGDLLWDLGVPSSIADAKDGITLGRVHIRVERRLIDLLAELGLAPTDIDYVPYRTATSIMSAMLNCFPTRLGSSMRTSAPGRCDLKCATPQTRCCIVRWKSPRPESSKAV
jgi:hypothetical protein